jgi:hypothetical protein
LEEAKRSVERAVVDANKASDEVAKSFDDIEFPELEEIEPELAEAEIELIYDSEDDWVSATKKLKERKALTPENEEDETGD